MDYSGRGTVHMSTHARNNEISPIKLSINIHIFIPTRLLYISV